MENQLKNDFEKIVKTSLNSIRKARGEKELDAIEFLRLVKDKAKELKFDEEKLNRQLNVGFSGGEKKKNEILQMSILNPKLAILDETDSGLDIDALRIVADGIKIKFGYIAFYINLFVKCCIFSNRNI